MRAFLRRNLQVFFKDGAAVFFSLLSSLMILGLYILFLGNVLTRSHPEIANASELMTNWIMAGLLAASTTTTSLGAFGVMINDKIMKINRDLYVSPIGRRKLAGGYVLSALVIGYTLTFITFVLAEVYIYASCGALISLPALFKVLALILLATVSNTAMVFFITSFFSSQNAFATVSTVVGTIIGFLTGIYIPIGQLPEVMQWVVKLFPPSYAAVLLRQTMMAESMAAGLADMPAEFAEGFKENLGIVFKFGETEVSEIFSIIVLLASALLFFLASVVVLSRKKRD